MLKAPGIRSPNDGEQNAPYATSNLIHFQVPQPPSSTPGFKLASPTTFCAVRPQRFQARSTLALHGVEALLGQRSILHNNHHNIEAEQIALADLPASFHDAVFVTRALNCRYLWIDSLSVAPLLPLAPSPQPLTLPAASSKTTQTTGRAKSHSWAPSSRTPTQPSPQPSPKTLKRGSCTSAARAPTR